nr:MAG TPA: hypothetical protein [Caudoviricetes sp.]
MIYAFQSRFNAEAVILHVSDKNALGFQERIRIEKSAFLLICKNI